MQFLRWSGYTQVGSRFHLELVHGLSGFRNVDRVAAVRHAFTSPYFVVGKSYVISTVVVLPAKATIWLPMCVRAACFLTIFRFLSHAPPSSGFVKGDMLWLADRGRQDLKQRASASRRTWRGQPRLHGSVRKMGWKKLWPEKWKWAKYTNNIQRTKKCGGVGRKPDICINILCIYSIFVEFSEHFLLALRCWKSCGKVWNCKKIVLVIGNWR